MALVIASYLLKMNVKITAGDAEIHIVLVPMVAIGTWRIFRVDQVNQLSHQQVRWGCSSIFLHHGQASKQK